MQPPVVEGLTQTPAMAKMLAMLTMLGLSPKGPKGPQGGTDQNGERPRRDAPPDRGPKVGPLAGPNLKTPA